MEAAKKKKRPLPPWYLNRPKPVPYENLYVQAFFDLSTERRELGGCIGPIPWSKILLYSSRAGLEPDIENFFCRVIRSMDVAYLSEVNTPRTAGG